MGGEKKTKNTTLECCYLHRFALTHLCINRSFALSVVRQREKKTPLLKVCKERGRSSATRVSAAAAPKLFEPPSLSVMQLFHLSVSVFFFFSFFTLHFCFTSSRRMPDLQGLTHSLFFSLISRLDGHCFSLCISSMLTELICLFLTNVLLFCLFCFPPSSSARVHSVFLVN